LADQLHSDQEPTKDGLTGDLSRSIALLSGMMISAALVCRLVEEVGYGEPIWANGAPVAKSVGEPSMNASNAAAPRRLPRAPICHG
jgi:hypothetical protein